MHRARTVGYHLHIKGDIPQRQDHLIRGSLQALHHWEVGRVAVCLVLVLCQQSLSLLPPGLVGHLGRVWRQ